MKAIAVQIGNSDDKLTQREWARFVEDAYFVIQRRAANVHFSGAAASDAPWQNFAWVFEVEEESIPALKSDLKELRERYKQDSVAWLEGEAVFV